MKILDLHRCHFPHCFRLCRHLTKTPQIFKDHLRAHGTTAAVISTLELEIGQLLCGFLFVCFLPRAFSSCKQNMVFLHAETHNVAHNILKGKENLKGDSTYCSLITQSCFSDYPAPQGKFLSIWMWCCSICGSILPAVEETDSCTFSLYHTHTQTHASVLSVLDESPAWK